VEEKNFLKLVVSHPSRWKTILSSLLLIVMTAAVTLLVDNHFEKQERGSPETVHLGAWGELKELDLRMEQPEEYVGFERVSGEGPLWTFGTLSEPVIHDLLKASGLGEDQIRTLIATRIPGTGNIVILKPDENLITSLDPEVRSKLYLQLSSNTANRFQTTPYYIPGGDVTSIFQGHRSISVQTRQSVEHLLYKRNGFTYFSDPEVVLKHVESDDERSDFLKAMTGQKVVKLKLMIRPDTDIDKPLNYWTLAIPHILVKDVRPLFESLGRLKFGGDLSIEYILPPLARDHLFITPAMTTEGEGKLPDCHWSALNFFNLKPDPRMSDNDFAAEFITRNYYEIGKPSIEGDLVLLINAQNRVMHSSVYLADNIVFTKNGINFAQPWVTMRINDMVGYFSALEPVRIAYFRRKDL
jgi:hypothetical protein